MSARASRSRASATSLSLALGCALVLSIGFGAGWWDAPIVDAHPRISTTLTWYADIAPLFQQHCTSCHATGTVSMPLAAYAEARPWARAIREEVLERRMPPPRGRPGLDAGVDDHPLSPMERDLIVGWIDGGAPEGRPDAARTATFWCRMHPEVRAERGGACPICGMDLAPFLPDLTRRYAWSVTYGRRTLTLSVTEHETGAVVRELASLPSSTGSSPFIPHRPAGAIRFERVHEYPLHLFIVSEDFQRFQHVHPELDLNGRFSLAWRPRGRGRYWFYGDFLPTGGPPQLLQRVIEVGAPASAPRAMLASASASASTSTTALIAHDRGVTAALTVPTLPTTLPTLPALRAGDTQRLILDLKQTASGAPVTDLEPYLGAWGHLFVVHEQHDEALHAHPESVGTTPGGPTIAFDVLFPRAGTYYVWAQVQRHHTIVTLPFRVHVTPRA